VPDIPETRRLEILQRTIPLVDETRSPQNAGQKLLSDETPGKTLRNDLRRESKRRRGPIVKALCKEVAYEHRL
jgi:hypothetical protein